MLDAESSRCNMVRRDQDVRVGVLVGKDQTGWDDGNWDPRPSDEMPEWCNDAVLLEYAEEVVLCLVHFGGLTEVEARQHVEEWGEYMPENLPSLGSRALFLHEEPYYYAMELLHEHVEPYWWHLPELWPPPAELRDPDWPNKIRRQYGLDRSRHNSPAAS
jgi:hypothetical protein